MTSIDMLGASLTFMKMNAELKELLDQESEAPAFSVKGHVPEIVLEEEIRDCKEEDLTEESYKACAEVRNEKITLENIVYMVETMSHCIIKNEIPFCELDSHAGDGDFGMSVAKGFRQLKKEWKELTKEHTSSIGEFLQACSMVIMEHCGGASGPIWGSAFRAAGKKADGKTELTIFEFADMMQEAVTGIQKTGEYSFGRGAVVGDKTLIDALVPCADTWTACADKKETFEHAFTKAAQAAVQGAKDTEAIAARMGRAGTVGDRSIGYPDAGAYALGVIFTDLKNALVF